MSDALTESCDARGVLRLVLNRPARHNAFDEALIVGLTDALGRAEARAEVRAVVLTSTGASFSAGADLGWMRRAAQQDRAANVEDAERLAALMQRLDRLARPCIALVQGPAYGGGVGLLACCDVVIAVEGARFALTEVRLGLIPAVIGPYVVRAIGLRQARRYFQTGEVFDAERARAIGLVHEIVAAAALEQAGEDVITSLLAGAPGAQAEAKALAFLCAGAAAPDPKLRAETARRIADRRASPEGREGIAAFLERRPPAWRG
jgi:methylglutaconyl-CoA hydratase